jgi:enamine deaminase RidA (YjgF/YER057c/UK114 family)
MSAEKQEVRFIGVPIHEFLDVTGQQAESGKYSDGTTIKPQVREALGNLHKALAEPRLKISSYVFCFSRHCFIIIIWD